MATQKGSNKFQKLENEDKCDVKGHEDETLKYGKNSAERKCWSCWKDENRGKSLYDKRDSIEHDLSIFEEEILNGFEVVPTFYDGINSWVGKLAFHTAIADEFNISNTIEEKTNFAHELDKLMNNGIKTIEDIEKEILVPLGEKKQLLATKLAYTQYIVSKIATNSNNLDFEQEEAENELLKKFHSVIVHHQKLIAQKNVELLIDSKSEQTKHVIRKNILKQLNGNNGATKTLESENSFVKIYVTYIKFVIDENGKIHPLIVGKTTITEAKRENAEVYSNIFGGEGRYGDFGFTNIQLEKRIKEAKNIDGKGCEWLYEYMLVNIFSTEKEALDEENRVIKALNATDKYTVFQS